MEYKNQTENRAFQEMLQAAVKRLQNRSGEDIAAKSGAVFHSSRNVLEVLSFYETIEIQLPEFCINSDMDEWHYLTLLHYLDMADGTEGSQKLITFGNLKDGLIRGTKFDRTAEQKLEKLLPDKDPVCRNKDRFNKQKRSVYRTKKEIGLPDQFGEILRQRIAQNRQCDRFHQHFARSRVHRILLVRAESVGGLHDDRDFLVFSADDLRSIQSVHHRHFDVHQDRFGFVAVFLEQCHDFFAILGPLYITFLSDDCFDQFEVAVVVLSH